MWRLAEGNCLSEQGVLPTNLPVISADEKRLDNLFLLEDDTLAIVDYESEDKLSNRVEYLNYITRVVEKFFEEENRIVDLRLIIIYTGDVEKASAVMETSCFSLRMESVFLVNLQSEEIYEHIKEKVERREILTEEEQMQLVILPLTERGKPLILLASLRFSGFSGLVLKSILTKVKQGESENLLLN